MDNTRLTIACEENREGGYEIEVTFERDSRTKFREAFISLDRPMPPYLIEESDINGVGAVKSAATSILSHIKNVIGKSMKTDSRIFTDREIDSMFASFEYNFFNDHFTKMKFPALILCLFFFYIITSKVF